jgi:hypothetical protein
MSQVRVPNWATKPPQNSPASKNFSAINWSQNGNPLQPKKHGNKNGPKSGPKPRSAPQPRGPCDKYTNRLRIINATEYRLRSNMIRLRTLLQKRLQEDNFGERMSSNERFRLRTDLLSIDKTLDTIHANLGVIFRLSSRMAKDKKRNLRTKAQKQQKRKENYYKEAQANITRNYTKNKEMNKKRKSNPFSRLFSR